MEAICGSDLPYWNLTLIWNSTQPDLPLCFQETSLVWTPCLFLLLITPFHLWHAFNRKQNIISKNVATQYQSGNSNPRSDFFRQDSTSSNNKTPRNSVSSELSNDSKRVLRNLATKTDDNNDYSGHCCADSFPFRQFRSSVLTGIKQTTTLILILLCFVELFYGLFTDFSTELVFPIDQANTTTKGIFVSSRINSEIDDPIFEAVTPGIKLAIFMLVLSIQYLHWRHQVVSSVSLFIFWCLFVIQAVFNTRSLVMNYYGWFENPATSSFGHFTDKTYVSIKLAENCLLFVEFVLALFPEPKLKSPEDAELEEHELEETYERHESLPTNRKFPNMTSLPPCPLSNASVLSRLTFCWVNQLIWPSFRCPPLTFSQIWALDPVNWSLINASKFSQYFIVQRKETKSKSSSRKRVKFQTTGLMWSVVRSYWPFLMFCALLKLCTSFLPYLSALFLSWLIQFMESRQQDGSFSEPIWHGAVYVALMLVVPMVDTLIHVQYNFSIAIAILRIKASMCNAIYRKSLCLSSAGREQFTTGEIINLMAIDTARIGDFFLFLNDTWSVPLQILFAIYLLWNQLDVASLAGLVLMFLIMPFNSFLVSRLRSLAQYVMEYKDKRLKLMADLLAGIKVLKLYAWEDSFRDQVHQRRDHELSKLRARLYFQAAVVFIFNSAPYFVTVSSFATYILMDPANNKLTPEKAFVSLALFNQLRIPFALLPRVIAFYALFTVSLKRVNRYMRGDELYRPNDGSMIRLRPDSNTVYDIKVESGSFSWNASSGRRLLRRMNSQSSDINNNNTTQSELPKPNISNEIKPTLDDINFQIKKGTLVAIIGHVGCGKSSLLSALLGEMQKLSGTVKLNRSIAYVAQQAWLQNETLRDNILFQSRYDEERYQKVIDACALQPDLDILPDGDLTEIGERGINLSGGQKQRVSLARACYSRASLYLFDDPLSALDVQVSKHIFDEVIGPKGMLRDTTRVLVTHRLSVLPKCDYILVMRDGTVVEAGTYAQLIATGQNGEFAGLIQSGYAVNDEESTEELVSTKSSSNHSLSGSPPVSNDSDRISQIELPQALMDMNETELFLTQCFKEIDELSIGEEDTYCSIVKPKTNRIVSFREASPSRSSTNSYSSADTFDSIRSTTSKGSNRTNSSTKILFPKELHNAQSIQPEARETSHQITSVEHSATGSVKLSCYLDYFKRVGLLAVTATILSQLCTVACNIAASKWLARWSGQADPNDPSANETSHENLVSLAIYVALGLGECLFTLATTLIISISSLKAAKLLHQDMLARLLRAPMLFFDTNPLGRILNRFSKDVDICDTVLNMNLRIALFTASRTLAAVLVIAIETPYVLIAVLLLAILYLFMQKMYLPTSRQLRRIESTTRSPVYSHFSETLSGCSTIRAFDRQSAFVMESNRRIDQNNVVGFAINAATQWIATRLEFLGYMVVFANALYCLIARDTIAASITGLTLTYSMTITRNLNNFIMTTSELENSVVSFERCLEYTNLDVEADYHKSQADPPSPNDDQSTSQVWPSKGQIEFLDYSTRYRAGLDLVLKSVSFLVSPGERIGVVGRTGAGKSSLTLALFRILERVSGQILIDEKDIADVGLHTLRSRLTIIPQDPILFTGTLRLNLDPFSLYSDTDLWMALNLVNLRPFVQSLESGLQHPITEGGENLSVGQRQLICLARALLRRSKILVLDEATAAIDVETDAIIQRTIHQEFVGCTVLTIAHRIETIFDYDRILVLHNGEVIEYDNPKKLLQTENSVFRSLAHEAGLV